MKRSRISNTCITLAGVAVVLVSIALSLAPAPANAGSKDLPVLLVHGIDGQGNYVDDNNKSDWIRGNWISKNLEPVDSGSGWAVYRDKDSGIFDSAPVYMLDYHDYHGTGGHLQPTAGVLSKAIDSVKKKSKASDVYIVSHSMGGLLARAAMSGFAVDPKHYDDWKDAGYLPARQDVYGLMTIDTPHRGCTKWSTGAVWNNARQDMSPLSDFMKDLNGKTITPAFCSVVVGNGWLGGDGVLTPDMQTPIDGTISSSDYELESFDIVHGWGVPGVIGGIPAQDSPKVKDFAIDRYRKALKKYQQPDQPLLTAENTVLAIDHSGSMVGDWDDTTKVEGAKSAAITLVNMLQGAASWSKSPRNIGLIQFDDETEALLSPTSDYDSVRNTISPITADGGTDLIKPIEEGAQQLESAGGGVLILLTDGVDESGNSDASIIAAADRARAKGITIFTIGFGVPGSDINEELLKSIAGDDSRYSYADPKSLVSLAGSLLYSQIAAVEQVLGKFEGTVQQGQTADAGEFDVASSQGNLQTVLYWPGSTLEMKLTDPSGAVVTSGYPGLTITRTEAPAQLFISNPKSGHWKMSVYGAETSMDNEPYYALASFKETSATITPGGGGSTNDGAGLVLGMIALVFAGGVGVVLFQRQRVSQDASVVDQFSSRSGLMLRSASGTITPLHEGVNTIGRADDQDIILAHETVSRHHAVVVVSGTSARIRDAESAAGVLVNGLPLSEKNLAPGDTIKLGDVVLTVAQGTQ